MSSHETVTLLPAADYGITESIKTGYGSKIVPFNFKKAISVSCCYDAAASDITFYTRWLTKNKNDTIVVRLIDC